MNQETAQQILDNVYAHGNRAAIFADLDPVSRGAYVSLICPQCGKRRAYTYQPSSGKTSHIIRCNREDKCGYKATFVQYMAGEEKPRGGSFINAVKRLADATGITISNNNVTPVKNPVKYEVNTKKDGYTPLDKKTVERFQKLQLEETALDYLKLRGISKETAEKFGICYASYGRWPHYVEDHETKKLKHYRQWYPGRLVVPVTDNKGTIISLYGRAIPGDRDPYKHLKHDFVGTEKGIFNQKDLSQESVHITEGFFDALAIIEAAKKQMLSKKYASAIHGVYGLRWDLVIAKNVCFVFDPDKAGENWIKLADEGKKLGKRIFFMKKEVFKGYEDIAEVWEKERYIDFQYQEYC